MCFESFRLGSKIGNRRMIMIDTDIDMLAVTSGATNPTCFNDKWAIKMGRKKRIAPGLLILPLGVGLLHSLGLFEHLIAIWSTEQVRLVAPVDSGDKIGCNIEAVEKKKTKKKDRGVVAL